MLERTRRKWVDIQVDIFLDAARRASVPQDGERFDELLDRLFPPLRKEQAMPRERRARGGGRRRASDA